MRFALFITLVAISAGPASADNLITYYRDGALYQQEASAVKGVIDIPLAGGLLEPTLKVVPGPGTRILTVEPRRVDTGSTRDKDFETLTEQRKKLEDRLQALATREAIFTSAAKSQSGKAPRKTKANPDPMQAIRQGTDFAIAQLEAVYTARRKTTQDIQKIDARLATSKRTGKPAEHAVRIAVTPARGTVTLRYATTERGWQPLYNLHLTGDGFARLQLSARTSGSPNGYRTRVSSGSLAEGAVAETFAVQAGSAVLADYRLPVSEEQYTEGVFSRYDGLLTNTTRSYLQAGEASLFRNGTYLGKFHFEGISSARSRAVSIGR